MSSYGLTNEVRSLRERMKKFINEEVIPAEPVRMTVVRRLLRDPVNGTPWA